MRVDFLLPLLLAVVTARAGLVTWTNTAGGNWGVSENWSLHQLPGANDLVVITNAGTYLVMLNVSASVGGLFVGGASGIQTLSLTNNVRLTINGPSTIASNGRLNLTGDDLRGSNSVTVAGILTWASGDLGPDSAITVAKDGLLTITGPAKSIQGTLTNAGTVQWTGPGDLAAARVLHNLAEGLFDVQNDQILRLAIGGSAVFINDGILRKSGGTGTTTCRVAFINNGRVETHLGTLALAAESAFNSGCVFSGGGTTSLLQGSNVRVLLDGFIHSENLALQGATISGTNTLAGTLTWTSGQIGSDAAITIGTDGRLIIAGDDLKSVRGDLTNAGAIQWGGKGDWALGRIMHNLASGVIDVQNDQYLRQAIGGSPVLINDGLFRKSAGTGKTTCQVPFVNNGSVSTLTGTLTLPNGSAFNSGCAFSGAGTNLLTSGTISLNGEIHSENLVLQGATLNGAGSLNGSLRWLSGTIDADVAFAIPATGQLFLDGAELKHLSGSVANSGRITWTGTGDIAANAEVHNLPNGIFEILNDRSLLQGIGGDPSLVNDGVFRKSAGAGTNKCAIPFVNRGTIAVDSGSFYFANKFRHSSGTISLRGGSIRTYDSLILESGRMEGFGAILADVISGATVAPTGADASLNITGGYAQLLAGSIEVHLASDPSFAAPGLNITGRAELNGSLDVRLSDGAVPEPGQVFEILRFGSRGGDFCCFNGLNFLGKGRRLTALFGITNLTLVTETSLEPTEIPLRVTVDDGALVCWPWEFVDYALFCSTNLNQPTWALVPGITNRCLEPAPIVSQKYFRLLKR